MKESYTRLFALRSSQSPSERLSLVVEIEQITVFDGVSVMNITYKIGLWIYGR